jgi:uncharacterized membrane protein YsdA (DUF1294 family)
MLFCKLQFVCLWVEQLAMACKACRTLQGGLVRKNRAFAICSIFCGTLSAMTICLALICLLLAVNIVTFCVFWWDKAAARRGTWRVPEHKLLSLAFFGGSLGAFAAQRLLRHKTRKEPFRTRLTAILILHAAVVSVGLLALPWVLAGHVFQS